MAGLFLLAITTIDVQALDDESNLWVQRKEMYLQAIGHSEDYRIVWL